MKLIILVLFFFISLTSLAMAAITPLTFTLNMSEIVTVDTTGGTPTLTIDVGGVSRTATFTSGSGTNALVFSYTPVVGDVDLDGITLVSPITLNGATIKDNAGNDIPIPAAFTVPTTTGIKINYPSLSMDFINDRYTLNETAYNSFTTFLSNASGTFTRSGTATYFDSSGVLQTAASGVPRFDYDPDTLAAKGLLMEDDRTNFITNSRMQGAVVGAPGTAPTNWSFCFVGGGATCSYNIAGTGTYKGMNYIDVRLTGNMPASGGYANLIHLENTNSFAVTSTNIVSIQLYLALVSGTIPANFSVSASERNGSTYLTNRTFRTITTASVTSTPTKFTASAVAVNGTLTNLYQPRIITGSNGTAYAYDFTLRVIAPQVEIGTYISSFIPTSGTAATRNRETISIPTGTWYNQPAGTYAHDVSWLTASGTFFPMFFRVDDTTANNRWNSYYTQSSSLIGGGGHNSNVNIGTWSTASSVNGSIKIAAAQSLNNANMAFNGAVQTNDTSWDPPVVTRFILDGTLANKWIKKMSYYPLRVQDAQLGLLSQ